MKIRYFMSPRPGQHNIGDHGQAYCLKNMFKNFFGAENVFEYPVKRTSDGLDLVEDDDIIFMSSGGNLGDLWPPIEERRREVIQRCSNNLIVSFPQTIEFTSKEEAEKSSAVYNAHPNLHVFARDPGSYVIAKELFSSIPVYQLPDPVFTLSHVKNFKREGILCIFRNDKEDQLKDKKQQIVEYCENKGFSVKVVDTNLDHSIKNREYELLSFLDMVSKYKLVITNRFHGTVFAAITGTPCLAFPTINHKITESSYWYRRLGTKTTICENIAELGEKINSIPESYNYDSSLAKGMYHQVLSSIKENKTVSISNFVKDCIISRRTVRKWNKAKIGENILLDIIDAGVYAPSGSNAQCVRFRFIQDKQKISSVCKECFGRKFVDVPPVIIMVGYDFGVEKTVNFAHKSSMWEELKFQDIAAAIQNMQLYCESIGLSCCWLSFFPLARQKFLDLLDIKNNNVEYLSALAVGFSKNKLTFETKHRGLSIVRKNVRHYILE